MCGGGSCFHGVCGVLDAAERCVCAADYSGSQCLYRGRLLSLELPLAAAAVALALVLGLVLTRSVRASLSFADSRTDAFAFPREWKRGVGVPSDSDGLLEEDEGPYRRIRCSFEWLWRVVGVWEGRASTGVPWKPLGRTGENLLAVVAVILELLPWVQATAVAFLPAVPWPATAGDSASVLRKSLLHPLWTHLGPAEYPKRAFYAALAFVPGGLLVSCVVGAKRFPLFKPQPKDAPAEDLCTLLLRVYSHWLALPAMIALLLPLECFFIGYSSEGDGAAPSVPKISAECVAVAPIAHAVASVAALLVFWTANCAVAFQLNCESSWPTPTLWTDVRYLRIDAVLRAPLAVAVVAFMNANGVALCACCVAYGAILGLANAWMKPCAHSLITGIRTYGAVMTTWSGAVGLAASLLDDPSVKLTFETWSLGAIAVTALASSTLLLIHSVGCCWPRRLGATERASTHAKASSQPTASAELTMSGASSPMRLRPRRDLARSRRRTRPSPSLAPAAVAVVVAPSAQGSP